MPPGQMKASSSQTKQNQTQTDANPKHASHRVPQGIKSHNQCLCKLSISQPLLCKFMYFIYFYFWLRWVLSAARRLSLVATCGDYSLLRCTGFSLWWLLLLWSTGSRRAGPVVAAHGLSSCGSRNLERRFSSCSTRA